MGVLSLNSFNMDFFCRLFSRRSSRAQVVIAKEAKEHVVIQEPKFSFVRIREGERIYNTHINNNNRINNRVEKKRNPTKDYQEKESEAEMKWTEEDTKTMLDLMETALVNVKKAVKTQPFNKVPSTSPDDHEKTVESLESIVRQIEFRTKNVVEEINSVMQLIAEVSGDNDEPPEDIPDIEESSLNVGNALSNDENAKKEWNNLVRKLSTKRKKSVKKRPREQKVSVDPNPHIRDSTTSEEEVTDKSDYTLSEEDNSEGAKMVDDKKPDFIPQEKESFTSDPPDVIPKNDIIHTSIEQEKVAVEVEDDEKEDFQVEVKEY